VRLQQLQVHRFLRGAQGEEEAAKELEPAEPIKSPPVVLAEERFPKFVRRTSVDYARDFGHYGRWVFGHCGRWACGER
jgi:hypothetical protein